MCAGESYGNIHSVFIRNSIQIRLIHIFGRFLIFLFLCANCMMEFGENVYKFKESAARDMFVETETEENPNHNCIHKNGIHTRVHLFLQLGICWIAFGKISLWRPCNQLPLKVNENMHEHAHFCLSAQMSTCNPTNHIICCVCTECESKNAKQSGGRKERNDMKGRLCMCVCVEHFERDSQLIGGDNEGNEYCFL